MGITPYRLAKEIGVSQRRIGEISAGKRAVTADTGPRLSRFFGTSDTANATAAFLQARNEGMTSDVISSAPITAERDPSRLDGAFAVTVTAIRNIYGKSTTSTRKSLPLLNLPSDMQVAVKRDKINVSLGYIFAVNLDNPALRDVFNACLEKLRDDLKALTDLVERQIASK